MSYMLWARQYDVSVILVIIIWLLSWISLKYGRQEEHVVISLFDSKFKIYKYASKLHFGCVFRLDGGAQSYKISKYRTIVDSTIDARYIDASNATKKIVLIKKFIIEFAAILKFRILMISIVITMVSLHKLRNLDPTTNWYTYLNDITSFMK